MPVVAIGLMFIIQGIYIIKPFMPLKWLGIVYIGVGLYVIYKRKGEIRL